MRLISTNAGNPGNQSTHRKIFLSGMLWAMCLSAFAYSKPAASAKAAPLASFTGITWSTVAAQPVSVSEAQAEVVNGKLYSFGGFDSQKACCTPTDRAFVYDPATNVWTAFANMPAMNGTVYGGVTHAGFANDGTNIYFAGGYTSNSTGTGQIFGTREAWKYIVAEQRYERLPDLPVTISAGQLEFLNGKLHHIGGTNASRTADLGNHYVLDLNNLGAGWVTAATLPTPRHHSGSTVYNNLIYYIGGQTAHDANLITSKEVHRYDPLTNAWTKMADLPVPTGTNGRGHISSAAIVYEDRIIVLGGETSNGTSTNMVSAYSPATNTWENLTPLPAARRSGTAGLLGLNLFYSGGGTSTTYKGIPVQTVAGCSPFSTLACSAIDVALPYNLNFNQSSSNTMVDKNGLGIGFSMAAPYSGVRTTADGSPTNPSVPGYEVSKLTLTGGVLQLVTNKGIFSRTENNQLNALGVRFDSRNRFQVDVNVINPLNGTSFQQGGIWMGLDDKTFIKLVVTGNKVEMLKETNDNSTNYPEDQRVTAVISGLNLQTVSLRLVIDPATNTAEAFYSTDGTTFLNAGESYATKTIDISAMALTAGTAYAGVFGTHRNSSTPVTYTFDNFSVTGTVTEPDPEPDPVPVTACSPLSPLPCNVLQVSLPLNLTFNQSESGTVADKNGQGTGFTLIDAYTGSRHSSDGSPSNTDVPGYEVGQLTLASGRLQILSNKGISYLGNNNQINALGVKFNSQNKYTVETTLINPFNGSSAQQGGIWLGQNDKTFLKLVVVGNKVELRRELNDVTGNSDMVVTETISGLNLQTVNLRLVIDPATGLAEAFYATDGVNFTAVGSLSVSGMNLTGGTALAGIYATHRNSSTPVTYTFDNFGIAGTVTEPDPTPDPDPVTACSPLSPLPCNVLQVTLPLSLTFNEPTSGTVSDKSGQGTGFTLIDAYTGSRHSSDGSPSNADVPGYEASQLTLGSGRLQIITNKGISYLGNNNQINALGVKFSSANKYQIETTLINPFNGSSAQQGGIWLGQNDKTFMKLVVVGNKVELRKEVNDVSGSGDVLVTETISGLNLQTVTLRLLVDPATNTADGFYAVDATNFIPVGRLSVSGMNLTGSTALAGIYATHRNSSTPVSFTFDGFGISEPVTAPVEPPAPIATDPNVNMVVDNLDKFPAPDHLVFSKIQVPWNGADKNTAFNYNHNKVTLRVHNRGTAMMVLNKLSFSKTSLSNAWKIVRVNTDSTATMPVNVASKGSVDIVIEFIAIDEAVRVATIHDTLYISSNDPTAPLKKVRLHGNWQFKGEGGNEPRAQEIINAFALKTRTGFNSSDGSTNRGTVIVPNSDEIIPSFFVRADPAKPVTVTQMAAYHSCCNTTERFQYYVKGSTSFTTLFTHYAEDGQALLPRISNSTTLTAPALARRTFNPTTPFGLKVGTANSDRTKNFEGKIGMRIWKAIDGNGNIIPNAYLVGNDYLGTSFTNYDYQDNIYYIENVKPEMGTAYYSELGATPSALTFDGVAAGSTLSSSVAIKNMGNTYTDGPSDPSITISRIALVGTNAAEFSLGVPSLSTLTPQATATLPVTFSPNTLGIKNAAIMVYYSNNRSLRIPVYGIGNTGTQTISNVRRIKSSSSASVVIAGNTWEADASYRIGNVKLDVQNPKSDVAGTDDDILYQTYLSSNADYNEMRYEIPIANGDYMIRMHHVENVWQSAGLRVFDVTIENQLKLSFLDIFKEVGFRAAIVKDYETTVTDGVLSIKFNPTADRLAIAGLEIFKANGASTLSSNSPETISSIFPLREGDGTLKIMRAYPNPNPGDKVFVELENYAASESVTLQLFDVSGRIIRTVKGVTNPQGRLSSEISLGSGLAKQMYIIRATSVSGVKQAKILIE